ncbi:MAG: heavy-metal-associated domain-containing protein [Lachnospiraceae bacterium]|nr:heavy-metal-associated domain-containing protein [Lachnospiraceae bacterium]
MVTIKIEGMKCKKCSGRVEKALNALDGVKAEVILEEKLAKVEGCDDLELLKKTVTDTGYEVTAIG